MMACTNRPHIKSWLWVKLAFIISYDAFSNDFIRYIVCWDQFVRPLLPHWHHNIHTNLRLTLIPTHHTYSASSPSSSLALLLPWASVSLPSSLDQLNLLAAIVVERSTSCTSDFNWTHYLLTTFDCAADDCPISAFRRGGLASRCKTITSQHHTTKHEIKVYKSL